MDIDTRLATIRQSVVKSASEQSFKLKIIKEQEAQEIAQSCDITKKPHDPAAFVDIALFLLTYPTELAFVIGMEFTKLAPTLGFQPFGTIMVAMGHIDSMYQGMIVRRSLLDKRPELDNLMNSKDDRIERAGKFLAAGMFVSTRS